MNYPICSKHARTESAARLPSNAFLCLNRYCPESFSLFCATCKHEHRDHAFKVLSLEDASFLVERLLKTPYKEITYYVVEAVDIMKKLKLIKDFRCKIDTLQKQIQREVLGLVENTEELIHQYASCKHKVTELAEILANIDEQQTFEEFRAGSRAMLGNLDYNFKRDRFEYFNAEIKQAQDRLRKSQSNAKAKIEEVKDYSMKIIEVILNEDSSDDEEDFPATKKYYEVLKEEIFSAKKRESMDTASPSEVKSSVSSAERAGRSSLNGSRAKGKYLQRRSTIMQAPPSEITLTQVDERIMEMEEKMRQAKKNHSVEVSDLKVKIMTLCKDRDAYSVQLNGQRYKQQALRKRMGELEEKLRRNKEARERKELRQRQLVDKIVDLVQWKGLTPKDHYAG